MEKRIFYTMDKSKLIDDEILKRRGFEYESAQTLGKDKQGYYFLVKGDKEFFKACKILNEAEEIKGKEKDDLLKKFEELSDSVISGMGGLF